jgi:hypothetical protein
VQQGWGPPQQPSWARPRIDGALLRPKAGWYALCALPIVLGVAAAAVFVVLAVRAFPDRPAAFTAPGGHELRLHRAEDQTIYLHSRRGRPKLGGVPDCSVRNARTRRAVAVRQSGSATITIGNDRYEAAIDFDPPSAGAYRVSCAPARGLPSQPLAVGERVRLGRFALVVVAAIGSFLVGLLLGGAVIAVVAIRRHSHKRRLEREALS